MAKMVFILTDTSQRYFDPNDKEAVEVVQTANVPANDLDEYSPFALYYQEGLVCKRNGLTVKSISGDDKKVTIEGFTKRGILPIPVTETFQIGDSYTADGMFAVSADGSSRSKGVAVITQIIIAKDDKDVAGILNAVQKLNTVYGRKIKESEQEEYDDFNNPEGIMMKAENDEFTFDGYESYMAEMGMASYPQERFFSSNV